jgi:NADH-quinone oxidoreductase subunit G
MDDMPILDLRIRKGVRRRGVRLAVATSRPSALDANAELVVRFPPGGGEALLGALDGALTSAHDLEDRATGAGVDVHQVRHLAALLGDAGEDVVVVAGERLLSGPRAAQAARALLNVAHRTRLAEHEHAGLLVVPAHANGRGMQEAGLLPDAGPGYSEPATAGRGTREIAGALAGGDLAAVYLLHADPLRTHPDRPAWQAALDKASTVIAHASVLTEGVAEHADVVFPAESYPEKEGTVTHPDGRLQRLRPAIGRPGSVRPEWSVLAELAERLGVPAGPLTSALVTAQLAEEIPFYAGVTLDEIGGQGVRWPERDAASAFPEVELGPFDLEPPPAAPPANGRLRLGTYRSLWSAPEVAASPAVRFLATRQRAELSPADAQRLGVADGDRVEVVHDGSRLGAEAAVRSRVPPGTLFLAEAVEGAGANLLTDGEPRLVEVRRES